MYYNFNVNVICILFMKIFKLLFSLMLLQFLCFNNNIYCSNATILKRQLERNAYEFCLTNAFKIIINSDKYNDIKKEIYNNVKEEIDKIIYEMKKCEKDRVVEITCETYTKLWSTIRSYISQNCNLFDKKIEVLFKLYNVNNINVLRNIIYNAFIFFESIMCMYTIEREKNLNINCSLNNLCVEYMKKSLSYIKFNLGLFKDVNVDYFMHAYNNFLKMSTYLLNDYIQYNGIIRKNTRKEEDNDEINNIMNHIMYLVDKQVIYQDDIVIISNFEIVPYSPFGENDVLILCINSDNTKVINIGKKKNIVENIQVGENMNGSYIEMVDKTISNLFSATVDIFWEYDNLIKSLSAYVSVDIFDEIINKTISCDFDNINFCECCEEFFSIKNNTPMLNMEREFSSQSMCVSIKNCLEQNKKVLGQMLFTAHLIDLYNREQDMKLFLCSDFFEIKNNELTIKENYILSVVILYLYYCLKNKCIW